jgi:hypothetical protein
MGRADSFGDTVNHTTDSVHSVWLAAKMAANDGLQCRLVQSIGEIVEAGLCGPWRSPAAKYMVFTNWGVI